MTILVDAGLLDQRKMAPAGIQDKERTKLRTGRVTATAHRPASGRCTARPLFESRRIALLALLLVLIALPTALKADPDYQGPLLYGLDPVIKSTNDPRLLGVERQVLTRRLERLGIDPVRDNGAKPDFYSLVRRRWDERSRVDLERKERLLEYNGPLGLMTEIEYPSYLFLFPAKETLPGGFTWYPPRRTGDPSVSLFVDDLVTGRDRRHKVARKVAREEALDLAGSGRITGRDDGLINLTIPVKLPRTLEKIIGKGEKTNIRITGRTRIALTGESSVTKPFLGNERVQSQSLFPSLDMEQELQVNLSGNIGEKIILEVDHNSAAIGPEATKIKLMYQGTEDEIIDTIETGDVGLTLPGSQLLGYNSNKSGLFGIKVTGQVGPADFTVVASKQKAETSSQTFNASGGQITEHEILSSSFIRNRFFRLTSDEEASRIPMSSIDVQSIRVYQKIQGIGNIQPGELENVAAFADTTGDWFNNDFTRNPAVYGARWREVVLNLDATDPNSSILVDEDATFWGIDVGANLGDTSELAVTYRYLVSENPDVWVRVGDDVVPARSNEIFDRGIPVEGLWYHLKLLKSAMTDENIYAHALMIRQVYALGGGNISPESFNLRVEKLDASEDQPQLDENNVPYLQIFGLDNGDDYGQGQRDDRPDVFFGQLFDLRKGLLFFPETFAQPFNGTQQQYEANAENTDFVWSNSTFLQGNLAPLLYDVETSAIDLSQSGQFKFVAEHASASNVISLNTSNVEEGSEVVKVNGQLLVRDQDYEIDYTFGEITLKEGSFTLTADSQISVSYQFAPFIGGGATSLMGFNLGWDLGRDSHMSTTWLYQTENIVGEKPKLGEEPSRTLVGNVNLQNTLRPGFLTTVANIVSRHKTERQSTVTFSGEIAASMPNPNTKGDVFLEDFEGVDSSNIVSLNRSAWTLTSKPIHGRDGTVGSAIFDYEDRVETIRWFIPKERVPRRFLNPDLVNQERDETQQVMDMYLRAEDGIWDAEDWGGIMRGVSATGMDLQRAQFVEIWLNDLQPDALLRTGRLHIDFGLISEDGYWPVVNDTLRFGTMQNEDANDDKIFTQDEDTGLGGITDRNVYSPTYVSDANPYPDINSTIKNNDWDIEDPNSNGSFEQINEYFSTFIDLRDTEALVDVIRDYQDSPDLPELVAGGHAWRKYRIPLSAVFPVADTGGEPDLNRIKHVRIWYEDDVRTNNTVRIQLSELRFLGSRWERQGMREVTSEDLLGPGDLLAGEEFFLSEVNNKENPDYYPPFAVRVVNNVAELEQSLVVNFTELDQGHMLRVGKQVSSQGDDYTAYTDLSWYWFNPTHETADLDLFFRIGADTLNYYEVRYRFAENPQKTGWKQMSLPLADLSNVKNGEIDGEGNRFAQVRDSFSRDLYDVRVVGRPDLRRIKRYYYVVANNAVSHPVAGHIYFNDVRLLGVKRDKGFAERFGVRVNMADVFRIDFDWNHRDEDFHGLDARRGSGVDSKDWNLSTSFAVEDFIPLFGFKLPVNFNRRQLVQRPKYEINSDIEIQDEEVRNGLSTVDTREGFSTRLSHPGSKAALLRYFVDPWTFTLSGSRATKDSPLQKSDRKSLQGNMNYDLRIPGSHTLSALPLVGGVPLVKAISFLPTHVGMSAKFTNTYTATANVDADGNLLPRPETRSKPLDLAANVDYAPLSVLGIGVTGTSRRDMLREQDFHGVNIGAENQRAFSTQLTFRPPRAKEFPSGPLFSPVRLAARGLNQLRPSVQFKGGFVDDHNPSIRRENDPAGIHSVNNSGVWEVRFNLPLGDLTKKYFPAKKYSDAERQRVLAEEQRLADRATRRGETAPVVELTPEEMAGLTPDQIQALREQRLLEAARRREEEDALLEQQRAPQEQGGRLKIPNPLNVVLNTLRNMQPVKITFTDKRNSAYARLTVPTPLLYKTGLARTLDVADSLYEAYSATDAQAFNLSVTTKMHRNVSLDVKYAKSTSKRDQIGTQTRAFQEDWPDAQVSLSGLERWPVFGGGNRGADEGWFKTSNLSMSYRKTMSAANITEGFFNPKTNTSINPRWTATFHSGLTATASFNHNNNEAVNVGSTQNNTRTRMGLQLRHQIRAQAFLARMGLYRPGSNPVVTMDTELSYDKDRSTRTDVGGLVGSETGNNRINFTQRFSYNITRNLTGAMRFIFGRSSNVQTGQTTTSIGLGLEATFVF